MDKIDPTLDGLTLGDAVEIMESANARTLRRVSGASQRRIEFVRHYHYEKPLWWESDAFHAHADSPDTVVEIALAHKTAPYLIAHASAEPQTHIAEYARLGYKTIPSEPIKTIMARRLIPYALGQERYPVQRVQTETQRQFFNSTIAEDEPHGQMATEDLDALDLRHYYIELDNLCVCQARAILPFTDSVNTEPLGTDARYRRRGLATALMNRLHADAAATGAKHSVINAGAMGVALYSSLGYTVLGYSQKFVPDEKA